MNSIIFRRSSAHCDLYTVQNNIFTSMAQTQQYPADQKSTDFFNFLERMQSQRMDDQRSCLVGLGAFVEITENF
ncbi:hypothetical protein M3Y98_00602100 [Aphelenchoides besseyi]|nr:hypothetical protein M3Y98_00602100 [Aphelenchoides besseyi]KAI6194083.1 hypothetical protein M3Y96_01087100 [Aphelenchoides besseyi]